MQLTRSRLQVLVLLFATVLIMDPSSAATQKPSSVAVTVALIGPNLEVQPVPLHAMRLISSDGDTIHVRTGIDGTASMEVRDGEYRLESVIPVRFGESDYSWSSDLSVQSGQTATVVLSNDNAQTRQGPVSPASDRRLDHSARLYETLRSAVVRVQAGLSHGSGFIADTLGGVVITNAHVVEATEETDVSVLLDPDTRVAARLLARDSEADVAVLLVHQSLLEGRPRVRLQDPRGRPPVVPGERLIAMGFPLNQELTMTSGIASSVRAGAIISDVNINPGNSGGPMLNVDGEAVAINTFGDFGAAGPGVSGSVLVARAGPALARAAARLNEGPPAPDFLPTLPPERLSFTSIKARVDSLPPDYYRRFSGVSVGGFDLRVQTPFQTFAATRSFEEEMARDRKRREAMANVPEAERYSAVREFRDWRHYVGEDGVPTIAISVEPRSAETGGSIFARVLISSQLQATYKFTGDVRGVLVLRDGEPLTPVKGGHAPVAAYVENRWVELKDVADRGFYLFDVEAFRPDSAGFPPSIVVAVSDLKSPRTLKCIELPPAVVARAWNDFEEYYALQRPDVEFVRAEPSTPKGRAAAWRSRDPNLKCSWSY